MSKLERKARASLEQLLDAMATARGELRTSEQRTRRVLKKVDQGEHLASVLISTEPAESRQSLDDAMEAVTSMRHRTRALIFALAVEEGLSIGEIGRTWGISRQLASRYVREGTEI